MFEVKFYLTFKFYLFILFKKPRQARTFYFFSIPYTFWEIELTEIFEWHDILFMTLVDLTRRFLQKSINLFIAANFSRYFNFNLLIYRMKSKDNVNTAFPSPPDIKKLRIKKLTIQHMQWLQKAFFYILISQENIFLYQILYILLPEYLMLLPD